MKKYLSFKICIPIFFILFLCVLPTSAYAADAPLRQSTFLTKDLTDSCFNDTLSTLAGTVNTNNIQITPGTNMYKSSKLLIALKFSNYAHSNPTYQSSLFNMEELRAELTTSQSTSLLSVSYDTFYYSDGSNTWLYIIMDNPAASGSNPGYYRLRLYKYNSSTALTLSSSSVTMSSSSDTNTSGCMFSRIGYYSYTTVDLDGSSTLASVRAQAVANLNQACMLNTIYKALIHNSSSSGSSSDIDLSEIEEYLSALQTVDESLLSQLQEDLPSLLESVDNVEDLLTAMKSDIATIKSYTGSINSKLGYIYITLQNIFGSMGEYHQGLDGCLQDNWYDDFLAPGSNYIDGWAGDFINDHEAGNDFDLSDPQYSNVLSASTFFNSTFTCFFDAFPTVWLLMTFSVVIVLIRRLFA